MRLSIRPLYSAISLAAVIAAGCSKSNPSSSSGTAVSATINGSAFTPAVTVGIFSQPDSSFQLTSYSIKNSDTTGLNLYFPGGMPLNTVQSLGDSVQLVYTNSATGKSYAGNSLGGHGSITLTSLDTTNHKLAGTFSGTLLLQNSSTGIVTTSDSVVITNGAFNSTYSVVAY